jgi:hypothetical protein
MGRAREGDAERKAIAHQEVIATKTAFRVHNPALYTGGSSILQDGKEVSYIYRLSFASFVCNFLLAGVMR